jgi:hypothetical protein
MAGSAWLYGAQATLLTFANGMTLQLMTPLVSVTLARPRISNASSAPAASSSMAGPGDIYGRYLRLLLPESWRVGDRHRLAVTVAIAAASGSASPREELTRLFTAFSLRTVLLLIAALFHRLRGVQPDDPAVALLVAGLPAAYLVARTRAGNVPVRLGDLDPGRCGGSWC